MRLCPLHSPEQRTPYPRCNSSPLWLPCRTQSLHLCHSQPQSLCPCQGWLSLQHPSKACLLHSTQQQRPCQAAERLLHFEVSRCSFHLAAMDPAMVGHSCSATSEHACCAALSTYSLGQQWNAHCILRQDPPCRRH